MEGINVVQDKNQRLAIVKTVTERQILEEVDLLVR
jgi:hypothetical protein